MVLIDYTTVIVTIIGVTLPLVVQQEINKRNVKNNTMEKLLETKKVLIKKIDRAVSRDSKERSKIYTKICDLEKKIDLVLKK